MYVFVTRKNQQREGWWRCWCWARAGASPFLWFWLPAEELREPGSNSLSQASTLPACGSPPPPSASISPVSSTATPEWREVHVEKIWLNATPLILLGDKMCSRCTFKSHWCNMYFVWKYQAALSGVVPLVRHHSAKQKATAGSIPSQGTCLGCGFGPQVRVRGEAIDRCFSHINASLPLFLPPSPSL